MQKTFTEILLLIFFACASPQRLFADGYDNGSIGLKSFAMGGTFCGVADDSSDIYHNPGGLSFLDSGIKAQISGLAIFPDFTYTTNTYVDKSNDSVFLPNVFFAYKIDNLAFGFGIYVPYGGGGVHYRNYQNSGTNYDAYMGLVSFSTAFAYRFSQAFGMGITLSLYYGKMFNNYYINPDAPILKQDFSGIAGFNFSIGALAKATEKLTIGFCIKSKFDVDMDGTSKVFMLESKAKVNFVIPFYFETGVSFQINDGFIVAFDASLHLWSESDKITVTQGSLKNETLTYYTESFSLNLGAEKSFGKKLLFRTGFAYSKSPTKDEGLRPTSNDVDQILASFGSAFKIIANVEIDLSLHYAFGLEREYNGKKYDRDVLLILFGLRFTLK